MLSFTKYLKESEMTYAEIEKILKGLGYEIKPVTRTRMAIVTDRRSEALNKVLNTFKGSKLLKDRQSLNVSSIGIVQIGPVQVIAKPASRNVLKAEQEATESLIGLIRAAVEQEGRPIDVLIGSYRIKSVVTAGSDQIRGDPKADIALIDNSNKEVGFISHKKEGGAKAFQQYGGISKDSGQLIYNDVLVKMFVEDVYNYLKKDGGGSSMAKAGFSVWRYIPKNAAGEPLIARSVYGPDWTRNGRRFGRDAVHCIGQGSPILKRTPSGDYSLSFSEAMHTADDLTWIYDGPYRPIFAATYRAGRQLENKGLIIKDMRGGIYPYDFISSRKAITI